MVIIMTWKVEYTDEFGEWWESLNESEQDDIAATVGLLEEKGPSLAFPYSSGIEGSRYNHMRELRIQHAGPIQGAICIRSKADSNPSPWRQQKW